MSGQPGKKAESRERATRGIAKRKLRGFTLEGYPNYSNSDDHYSVDVTRLAPGGAVIASGRIASTLIFTGFVPTPHSALLATLAGAPVLVRMRLD